MAIKPLIFAIGLFGYVAQASLGKIDSLVNSGDAYKEGEFVGRSLAGYISITGQYFLCRSRNNEWVDGKCKTHEQIACEGAAGTKWEEKKDEQSKCVCQTSGKHWSSAAKAC